MFTMNKYIGAHIEPYKPVDLTTNSTPKKRKAKRKSKDGKKRKGGGGLNAPFRVSDDLAAVTGERILSRPQVTKKLWEYIRENNLQVSAFGMHCGGLGLQMAQNLIAAICIVIEP